MEDKQAKRLRRAVQKKREAESTVEQLQRDLEETRRQLAAALQVRAMPHVGCMQAGHELLQGMLDPRFAFWLRAS